MDSRSAVVIASAIDKFVKKNFYFSKLVFLEFLDLDKLIRCAP